MPVHTGYLRVCIHYRGARLVFHGLSSNHGADLFFESFDLLVIWSHSRDGWQCQVFGQLQTTIIHHPRLKWQAASGFKIRSKTVKFHDCIQSRGDIRDVGHHSTFLWKYRVIWGVDTIDAKGLNKPVFFVLGFITATGHCSGMSDCAGQSGFPTPNYAGYHWFAKVDIMLVVAARFHVKYGRFSSVITLQCMGKVSRGIVDINIFSRWNKRCCPPAFGCKILGNRGGESAWVRENRNGSF